MKVLIFCFMIFSYCINVSALPNIKLKEFLKNDARWVKDCQGNRIYLNTEYLTVNNEGMYILNEKNKKISITELFADSQGSYTRAESLMTEVAVVYPIVWCKTCNAWRTVNIEGCCVKCGNNP